MEPENTQPQDHPTEPLLEAQLLQSKQIGEETNGLLETLIHQGEKNNVEPVLEATLAQSQKNTDRIVEAVTNKPDVQKIKIVTDESELADNFFRMLRGQKGEKGDKGDSIQGDKGETGEKGDKGDQGDRGFNGTDGRDGVDGKDGQDGKDGRDGLDGKDGKTGSQGPKGDPGKDAAADPTIPTTIKKLKAEINRLASSFSGAMVTYRANGVLVANGSVLDLVAGTNVTLGTEQTSDGAVITINASGGGSGTAATTTFTPAGTIAATDVQAALEELDADIQGLSAGAGISRTVVVTSGSITVGNAAATDYVYFIAGAHTMSLPAAASNKTRYTFKNNHSVAITIDTAGAETIDGGASIQISPEDAVDIISDGTNYYVV